MPEIKKQEAAGLTYYETHKQLIEQAQTAIEERVFWAGFPEIPSAKIYGETAKADGLKNFESKLNEVFEFSNYPKSDKQVGAEKSPFGLELNVQYPSCDTETLIQESTQAGQEWSALSPSARIGVCLEMLKRINDQSFLIANAVMHTTGQAFGMAFQAGGPHAQDRGLEALAYAFKEIKQIPNSVDWEKPMGKHPSLQMHKEFRVIPRGIALAIACATFPTWNTYPGIFASLATGNSVIIKPHPNAILPLAVSIEIMRDVLSECGLNPNTVLMAVDEVGSEITKELALKEEVKIIDYTGSKQFGSWLKENCPHAQIYTEEAGVNSIIITSTDNVKGMYQNIAMSLCLYSGQMCTAPQNIYIPQKGIDTNEGHKSFDEVCDGLKTAVNKLLSDPDRAAALLGAICNPQTLKRVDECSNNTRVLRNSSQLEASQNANIVTPLMIVADMSDDLFRSEQFGPISFVIATSDEREAIETVTSLCLTKGAITASVYSTDDKVIEMAKHLIAGTGALLSINLTGQVLVNQTAAFSDYHVSGANPAGNATLADSAYVANRFRVAETRTLVSG